MRFKLDENIGCRGQGLLRASGHDVATVHDQQLRGARDELIYQKCARENRALVTMDHDFCQVPRFLPEKSAGIVILEMPARATPDGLLNRLREMLALLDSRPPTNEL